MDLINALKIENNNTTTENGAFGIYINIKL